MAEHRNSGRGCHSSPYLKGLKGAQERAGEFPKRTLRSASKARRKAARGADKSQGGKAISGQPSPQTETWQTSQRSSHRAMPTTQQPTCLAVGGGAGRPVLRSPFSACDLSPALCRAAQAQAPTGPSSHLYSDGQGAQSGTGVERRDGQSQGSRLGRCPGCPPTAVVTTAPGLTRNVP